MWTIQKKERLGAKWHTCTYAQADFQVVITSIGASLKDILLRNKAGTWDNLILSYQDEALYLENPYYLGSCLGPCANRIEGAKFFLAGQDYQLDQNNGEHHLHGGKASFSHRIWEVERSGEDLVFLLDPPETRSLYPADLELVLRLGIRDRQIRLNFEYQAEEDTIVNLSNHAYFNLAGRGDIRDHYLLVPADSYCEVRADLIPSGKLASVTNTAFDFRSARQIQAAFDQGDSQLDLCSGFDHCFCLKDKRAKLICLESKRQLEVETDAPGLQVYTANQMGFNSYQHPAICLEAGSYPNSINQNNFPSVVLKAKTKGERYIYYNFTEVEDEANI